MDRSDLLDHLTDDVLTYVMHGSFPKEELADTLKYEQLDERFRDYQLLMDLHFILQEDVIDFVTELPHRIRRIKTQTENVERKRHGTVDGRINWSSTIQERYASNPNDRSLFICENRSEDYDIDENIVLKRLLSIIYTTLQEAADYFEKDYRWVNERWKQHDDLVEELTRIVERNVHVTRIKEPAAYEPTDRMLTTAHSSRQPIYQEAAELIERRQKLLDGDRSELERVLDQTAITPDDEETLLELFTLFRFIDAIQEMQDSDFTLHTIERNKQEIARLEDDGREIVLYHDSSASEKDLSFIYSEDDIEEPEKRPEKVQKMTRQVMESYFDKDTYEQTGRPDVIVLEIREEDSFEYLITEVKNSTNRKTISQGIKEGLEYLAFLKQDGEWEFQEEAYDVFGSGYNGLLVTQDLEEQKKVADQESQPLTILQAGQLVPDEQDESQLRKLLENVI